MAICSQLSQRKVGDKYEVMNNRHKNSFDLCRPWICAVKMVKDPCIPQIGAIIVCGQDTSMGLDYLNELSFRAISRG